MVVNRKPTGRAMSMPGGLALGALFSVGATLVLTAVLAKLVEDIASGSVEPNPYTRGAAHDACRFCPYGAVCHAAAVTGRRNYKTMDAQQFWEEIGKEMGKHGG